MCIILKGVHFPRRLADFFLLLGKPLALYVPVHRGDGTIMPTCSSNNSKAQFAFHSFSRKCICVVELCSPTNAIICPVYAKLYQDHRSFPSVVHQHSLCIRSMGLTWEHLQNANVDPLNQKFSRLSMASMFLLSLLVKPHHAQVWEPLLPH